jgi:Spy/CpxP family protein refolding chaperone
MKRVEIRTLKADLPAANSVASGGANELAPAPAPASVPGPVAGAAPYRRLPSGYGKLSLSDRQRDRIYALRGGYRARIEQLEEELAALKAAETEACESVLTADQLAAYQRGKKTSEKAARP